MSMYIIQIYIYTYYKIYMKYIYIYIDMYIYIYMCILLAWQFEGDLPDKNWDVEATMVGI